jgi:hypothetical protein
VSGRGALSLHLPTSTEKFTKASGQDRTSPVRCFNKSYIYWENNRSDGTAVAINRQEIIRIFSMERGMRIMNYV